MTATIAALLLAVVAAGAPRDHHPRGRDAAPQAHTPLDHVRGSSGRGTDDALNGAVGARTIDDEAARRTLP